MPVLSKTIGDYKAELCALSHILSGEKYLLAQLQKEDFSDNGLRQIFLALQDHDIFSVEDKMRNNYNWLEQITSAPYLGAPFNIVQRLKKMRAIREAERFRVEGEAEAYPDQFRSKGEEINKLFISKRLSLDDIATRIQDGVKYTPCGFSSVDSLCGGGLEDGGVFVVAARPGLGKTALAVNIAKNMISQDKTVYFGSLEMPEERILERLLQCFWKETKEKVKDHVQSMKSLPGQIILDNPSFDLGKILSAMSMHLDADVFVLDYYQLIQIQGKESPIQKLEIISNRLKEFAFTHKKPLILLAQLNRSIETDRVNREPMLSDLRGCGALEQDATTVTFLWDKNAKEESMKMATKTAKGLLGETNNDDSPDLKWLVKKNRNGQNGCVDLNFDPLTMTFTQKYGM